MPSRRVYRHIGVYTEWIENYRPGGYHPVHIGDRLGPDDRYLIQKKLGWGGEATVWLAHDSLLDEPRRHLMGSRYKVTANCCV